MMNKISTFVTFLLAFTVQQTYASLVTYDFSGNYAVLNFNGFVNNNISDDPFGGRKFNGYMTYDNSDDGYTGCCDNETAQYISTSNLLHINFETTSGAYAQFEMAVSNVFVYNNWHFYDYVYDGIELYSGVESGTVYKPIINEVGVSELNYAAGVQLMNYDQQSLYTDLKLSNKKLSLLDFSFIDINVYGSHGLFASESDWLNIDFIISGRMNSLHERLPTPVDIPSTAPLFLTGFLMLLWRRARKNS